MAEVPSTAMLASLKLELSNKQSEFPLAEISVVPAFDIDEFSRVT